ncbi:hypothetical protein [Methanolobus chelungpuianus]|uniref:Uncharacterized protein n=1 Tax=Methanolobus chelungpuianus TaxID=502115 RepID=A0AAE3H968_9EURY|nr:hypothetical protein [Methanolobus chelungpuianus]MCQ6961917.1 hypothetical protein [Methanolobus chelungpuianus]
MNDKSMSRKKGRYTLIASLVTSILLVILFAVLSAAVNSSRSVPLYTQVDIIAGMVFVFVLSMIVSASVWPAVIEKRMKGS